MRRLLVPLDGSAFAESALPYAVTVAQGPTPCAIDLVGVDVPEPLVSEGLAYSIMDAMREAEAQASVREQTLRQYLLDHPALARLLGFDPNHLPSRKHFGRVLRELPNTALQFLLDASVQALAEVLPPEGRAIFGDTVSIVTWNTENTIRMSGYGVSGPDDPLVLAEIDELFADGGTDLHNGLVQGYMLADAAFEPGRINRMVLVSDGGANVGITDVDLIAGYAASNGEDGIYMVGVGVGTA